MSETESPQTERVIKRGHSEVLELAESVPVRKEVKYLHGHKGEIAEFEILSGLPLKTGYSWGEKSGTMSFKWKGEGEENSKVLQRVESLTSSLDIKYPGAIHMLGVLEGDQEQYIAVDQSDLDKDADETVTKANCVYTLDPEVALVIRPADCPISVIYGKTKDGKDLAGFVHSAGVSVNAGIPRQAIETLIRQEEIIPESIKIGITPGISKENYSINDEITIERTTFPVVERNWDKYIQPKLTDDITERRNIDILRATIMQYIEAGISPEQIEAYGVDTYEGHKKGVGFSHRYFQEHQDGEEVSPGRYMVAVQLQNS